ncbi:hypothetical protein E4T56_gene644 [Termitomyces sp. T112]|nr:hypothetical protein E4T56_gene644 [Termitomyces sp. T112]
MVLASRSRSGMVPGVVHPVPMGSRVAQADMMPEYFAEAMERARRPPTLKCACPVPGGVNSASLRSPCQECSRTRHWHAACIVAEQGWDCKWVATQLEEGWRGRVSGRGSGVEGGVGTGRPPMKIGPLRSGWREGAPAMCNKGKWRASPSLEAGPSKWAWGELVMAGPPSPTVYSPTSGALVEQSAGESWSIAKALLQRRAEELERLLATCREEIHRVGEERDGFWRELDKARKERDLAHRDKDITVGTTMEQLLQLQELQACIRPLEAQAEAAGQQLEGLGMWGTQRGSSAKVTQVTAERACQWEEWLANEAASGQQGVLHKLGQGALHPPRQSVSGAGIHSRWVGEDAQESPAGIGAGGHADGASAGGTLAEGNSRPQSVVGGGGGCGRAAPGASQSPGNGSSAAGSGSGGKDSGGGDTAPASGSLILFRLPKVGYEQGSAVGDNVVWESMLGEYVFEKQFGKLWSIVGGVAGNEEGLLGEAANNNEDRVKAFGVGEFNNMIHQ